MTKVYKTEKARLCAYARYRQLGYNYFVFFLDAQGFGLQVGKAEWLNPGELYHLGYRGAKHGRR